MVIPLYKRLLSYVYPVLIRRARGAVNPLLELYLYRGQLQLATLDAMYSDGARYKPVITAFKEIGTALQAVKRVLVLGTGLGSAVKIMNKEGYYPHFTLVDNDEVVLQWALEFLENNTADTIMPVCNDAKDFVVTSNEKYDLVMIDIFSGRVVPGFVTSIDFLAQCRKRIAPGGYVVLNYIINKKEAWEQARANVAQVFPGSKVIDLGLNRVLIATV